MTFDASRWRRRSGDRPLVIAHRGASKAALENTAAAFSAARAAGADGVELDVRMCRDGALAVIHDADLRRLAASPLVVADASWAELSAIRLADGSRIPSLEEALEALGPKMLVNVEIKSAGIRDSVATAEAVLARLSRRPDAAARVLVSAFHPAAVARARLGGRRAGIPVGLLFAHDQAAPLRRAYLAPVLRPFALHPDSALATPARIAGWHRRGYQVVVWTVDDPAAQRRLAAAGADAIITNDPAAARATLAG